jgi:hypothetical protein
MFNFQDWINTFRSHYMQTGLIYNDAVDYDVQIEGPDNPNWRVLGIHHLAPEENRGNHNVYVEALCKQWERDNQRVIHWTWVGRRPDQDAPDFWPGQKPSNELVNLPINLGMTVSVWVSGGEKVINLSSNHPDEGEYPGNRIGHHSFFICFQEVDKSGNEPEPFPEPEPKEVVMLIKKSWLDQHEIDEDGFIRVRG